MSDELYQQAIKDLAHAAHGAGRLKGPHATALRDNPFCGDRVRIDVALRDGRVTALAHDTKGCLLCRASASILGLCAAGREVQEIITTARDLRAFLASERAAAPAWDELAVFAPARAYPSRHGCVLLPFEAFQDALGPGTEPARN